MKHELLPSQTAPQDNTPGDVAGITHKKMGRTPTGRTKLKESEKIKVWVRAGGTCVLCNRYLLEGHLTGLEVSLGELAHIVGQQNTARSPRGLHPMPREERDSADNVILACESCHEEIDDQLVTGVLDVEALAALKAQHEQRVRSLVTLPDDRRSMVLRMIGQLRGNAVEITRATAAETVVTDGRFPSFELDRYGLGVEIDLTALPGESGADELYYAVARRAIDEVMDTKVHDAVKSGDVRHLSVFAFARLPLLVYLGWRLDDGVPADVYQRHRSTDSWAWPSSTGPAASFSCKPLRAGPPNATNGILLTNLTGTAHLDDLPAGLSGAPAWEVAPAPGTAAEDIIASPSDLAGFEACVRAFFTALEATNKPMRRLHVFGPLPLAAAVTLGRLLKAADLRPALVLYDKTPAGYVKALEI